MLETAHLAPDNIAHREGRLGVWVLDGPSVISRFGTADGGLSEADVERRRMQFGSNVLGEPEGESALAILVRQFASPLVYVLIAALALTIIIGHWADAIVIAIVLVINATIGFFQEYRAENAMRALLGMVTSSATVVRAGKRRRVASSELVPGDIVALDAGDLVPADVRLLTSDNLRVDQSLLTGESQPVAKHAAAIVVEELAVADRANIAFLGTSIVSGRARGVVFATGPGTQLGEVASSMRATRRAPTPLQERMLRLGRFLTVGVLVICAALFAIGSLQGRPTTELFLVAVSVAVSAIPEGLPIVVTVALAVGVRRMAARGAVVRRLAAVETLGSCTVIATDKTGTLTENRMTVRAIESGGRSYCTTAQPLDPHGSIQLEGLPVIPRPDEPLGRLLAAAVLANEAELIVRDGSANDVSSLGDPTEVALLVAGLQGAVVREKLLESLHVVAEVPFDATRRYSAAICHDTAGSIRLYVKGAPERVIEMCDRLATEPGDVPIDRVEELVLAHRLASAGLRVLAVADGEGEDLADAMLSEAPRGLTLLGMVGLMDPPRPEAIAAIGACSRSGIRVVMITGDHASTAAAISRAMRLSTEAAPVVLSGTDIDALSHDDLAEALRRHSIYARMSPTQKLGVVNALRSLGEVVAVTGDGVNDAPALKSAHIGVAMGRSGTDVAREAADLVVTDDNFATIYAAVEEGRVAFANIRNATFFLVSSGIGELIAIIATLAMGLPLPLLPAQILWLNVVTNGIEDVALAFEPGEPQLLTRPPRPPKEGILSRVLIERSVLCGVTMAAGAVVMFLHELSVGSSLAYAQVATLTMLVMFELVQVGNSRSETMSAFRKSVFSNRLLLVGTALSLAVHVGAMYWAPTQTLLRLQPLTWETWIRILVSSLAVLIVVELHKIVRRPEGRAATSNAPA